MNEAIGTTRWFGESWGAPVCHPQAQVPIPFDTRCSRCNIEFKEGDQGISIPRLNSNGTQDRDAQHLNCFLHTLGIDLNE